MARVHYMHAARDKYKLAHLAGGRSESLSQVTRETLESNAHGGGKTTQLGGNIKPRAGRRECADVKAWILSRNSGSPSVGWELRDITQPLQVPMSSSVKWAM